MIPRSHADWVNTLEQTGALAKERRSFGEELVRLGLTLEDASFASLQYVPDPKMVGEPEFAARQ
jgi:hypothetical protein